MRATPHATPHLRALRAVLYAAGAALLCSGCVRHEAILQPRGLSFSPEPSASAPRTIGHLETTTYGLNLFLTWAVTPGGSLPHQDTYDRFAVEAGAHGAGRVLDLRATRTQVPLLPPIVWLHVVTVSGNLTE